MRDLLMNRTPHDFDITTSAHPEQVKRIFASSRDTGLRHGTVTVVFMGESFEITTWRKDAAYIDHRHPEGVEFTDSLEADLARRDFTINAMAYHPEEGLIDPFGGRADIGNKLIRSVGDPIKRFGEDALRMLRAVRFSAQLGFEVEEHTLEAIKKLGADLAYVSPERIRGEIDRMLGSDHPEKFKLIWSTGLDRVIFPEVPHPPEILDRIGGFPPGRGRPIIILSALFAGAFHEEAAERSRAILRRLRYDNHTIRRIAQTLQAYEELKNATPRNIRRACSLYGHEAASLARELLFFGMPPEGYTEEIYAAQEPESLKLTGDDLISIGMAPGKEVGTMLSALEMCVFKKPGLNEREALLMLAKEILSCVDRVHI